MPRKSLHYVLILVVMIASAWAQNPYGIGDNIDVPYVEPGTISTDGVGDEAAWATAAEVDVMAYWEAGGTPDITIDAAKLLWSDDTLFVYVKILDDECYWPANEGDAWDSDKILIGLDRTLADDGATNGDWGAWPENFPDLGAVVHQITAFGAGDPQDSLWVNGTVFVDTAGATGDNWGFEMAFYLPNISTGGMVGFNMVGAAASLATTDWGEHAYTYYSWHPNQTDIDNGYQAPAEVGGEAYAGDINRTAACFGTLTFTGGPAYVYGDVFPVPYVAPGAISVDGAGDETPWQNAATLDLVSYWEGGWAGNPYPIIYPTTKLLWSEDTLYLYVEILDDDIYLGSEDEPWTGDQIMIAVDALMQGVGEYDSGWDGAPWSLPYGPATYRAHMRGLETSIPDTALTSGWFNGTIVVDEANNTEYLETAIYMPQAALGTSIGFMIGGVATTGDTTHYNEYETTEQAWYAAYPAGGFDFGFYGGSLLNTTDVFGKITFVLDPVSVDGPQNQSAELPDDHRLIANFPNPFNPSTTISYHLSENAHAVVEITDALGRHVETLIAGKHVAGYHVVSWNAGTHPSGLYFYSLKIDGEIMDVGKALLLK
ncbi:MAG: T9SS type A sorting domain-containing protein [Candidatus Marinimicrobia bacterium]|nr:T9SS type A sorting domain-containing protein [Candidatus Neomarinimicrobiota bacterium]MCF7850913.1 T9SS type A sorting domain-containing protein [Candidatus Neomarinimicrobiota bacterium]MCF7905338.1 T9SS type A sorting domain-containing protein [Candidatus Neomarinimicrobiota bacterium]